MPDSYVPGSTDEWIAHAKSDLALSQAPLPKGVLLESLCFHAQQAAEKAIKAVYVHQGIRFRYTHDIGELLAGLRKMEISFPDKILEAAALSDYSGQRYPGPAEPVTEEEYREAVKQAESVLFWAEKLIG